MYGIPEHTDFGFLAGKELSQVCIGAHQLVLNFWPDVTISVEGEFIHLKPGVELMEEVDLPRRSAGLVSLLGSRVDAALVRGTKILRLEFSNAEVLELHDNSEAYESFQVTAPGVDIIV